MWRRFTERTAAGVSALRTAAHRRIRDMGSHIQLSALKVCVCVCVCVCRAEVASLRRDLQALSERFSHKCLELKRAQQQHTHTHTEMSERERQVEQLKRENQDLQARLAEEVKVIRSLVTGQGSDAGTDGSERSWCEMQVLLRVRENELQYLQQELNSLRNQLHFLTTEKSSVCERYREVCEELSSMKSRSEREADALREHLRLALSALHEQENSLRGGATAIM